MQNNVMHPSGTFCWADLGTSEIDSSATFYADIFDWKVNKVKIESWIYVTNTIDKKEVSALYQIIEGQVKKGYPTAWIAYLAVDHIDDYAEKITALGGKILRGPFDISDQGRTISLQDPMGATFYLWQAEKHKGAGLVNELGTATWYELATHDTEKACEFYTQLLGWEAETRMIDGERYTLFSHNGQKVAGMVELTEANTESYWRIYFSVKDCDTAISKVLTLGGNVSMKTTHIEGVGNFAALRDPQGVKFSITDQCSLDW